MFQAAVDSFLWVQGSSGCYRFIENQQKQQFSIELTETSHSYAVKKNRARNNSHHRKGTSNDQAYEDFFFLRRNKNQTKGNALPSMKSYSLGSLASFLKFKPLSKS